MLLNLRNSLSGTAKFVLVAIITVPFALFGVDALFVSGGSEEEIANVDGESISTRELQQAVLVQKQQLKNKFQGMDESILSDDILRPAVLQRLIQQKVEELAAKNLGMGVSIETVYDLLSQVPEFKTDGKFDAKRYEFVVRQMGYTPTSHQRAISSDLLVNQFLQGIITTGFTTEKELELLAELAEQTRDYYYLTIPSEPLKNSLVISDEEVESYYQEYANQFMTDEQVIVEYIELQPSDLLQEVSVSDDMIEQRYQEKVTAAKEGATVHAAHIFLDKQEDGSNIKKMATIQEKIKSGEEFAVLAREYSEDFVTADKGGDLGYTQSGDLPKAVESAIENLSIGEVSGVVQSDAGIHLVKLLDKKSIEVPTREALESSIREELALQMARNIMPERIEELKDISYNTTSLRGTADQMALDLKLSSPFSRSGGDGIAKSNQVVKAAYSQAVLDDGYVSEVIELSENLVLVLTIHERIPSALKPLAEVKSKIVQSLRNQKANEQLLVRGAELQKRVTAGESLESVAKAENLKWQVSLNTKRLATVQADPVRQKVFSLVAPADKPVVDGLILPNGDYVLVSLTKVTTGDARALGLEQKQALTTARTLATAGQSYKAYGALLLQDADIASKL